MKEVKRAWKLPCSDTNNEPEQKMVISKNGEDYIAISSVYDYVYRPPHHRDMCLYDWILRYRKVKCKKSQPKDEVWADVDLNTPDEIDALDSDHADIDDIDVLEQEYIDIMDAPTLVERDSPPAQERILPDDISEDDELDLLKWVER